MHRPRLIIGPNARQMGQPRFSLEIKISKVGVNGVFFAIHRCATVENVISLFPSFRLLYQSQSKPVQIGTKRIAAQQPTCLGAGSAPVISAPAIPGVGDFVWGKK